MGVIKCILRNLDRRPILRKAGLTLSSLMAGIMLCHAQTLPSAEIYTDSATIHFRQSRTELNTDFNNNGETLNRMVNSLRRYSQLDSMYKLREVRVTGSASPEGSVNFNRRLSEQRARRIFDYFSTSLQMPDSITRFEYMGRDWRGLRDAVASDMETPCRSDVLSLLDNTLRDGALTPAQSDRLLADLKKIGGGEPYEYMYRKYFPALRSSKLYVKFDRSMVLYPPLAADNIAPFNFTPRTITATPALEPIVTDEVITCKPFYMALKTNMLLDVLALPSVSAEFYLGKNFTAGVDWTYGWWKTDRRHRYWRAYGGDIFGRWWFGRKAAEKPLTGHHVGIYAGIFTYDFEWGGTGYMGGRPGHSLWDRFMVNAGVEYGYSLPIARRLNIDFTLGFGYVRGKVEKYEPINNIYYWESTSNKTWIGPTKAEVSLVWLIGCDNINKRKGGKR